MADSGERVVHGYRRESGAVTWCRGCISMLLVALVIVAVLLVTELVHWKDDDKSSNGDGGPDSPKGDDNSTNCPHKMYVFEQFPSTQDVILKKSSYLIDKNITVNTITVQDGAKLVIADTGKPIKIRTKYILIINDGSLLIGSETCRYKSRLDIELYGKSDDPAFVPSIGRKFIGVGPTGTIDIHGLWKLSWTQLESTIHPGAGDVTVDLVDDASSWTVGDKIVIASSTYDMYEAEVFQLIDCPTCSNYQVKIKGPVKYVHYGELTEEGVDVRAEVGLLTRNIKIYGEMEATLR